MFRLALGMSLAPVLFLAACGGGGNSTPPQIGVSVTPSTMQTISAGQNLAISAAVANDSSAQGVSWTLSGVGSLSGATSSTVSYVSPASVASNQTATVTATSVANSSISSSLQITVTPAGTSANVVPLVVDGGPTPAHDYANGVFTSVTICVPGTANCQTIDGVLVDTGSYGLRVLQSSLTLSLTPLTSGGNVVNNCVQFVDGTFLWGQVAAADVRLGGESASNVSIQLIANPTGFTVPTSCSAGGTNNSTLSALGANGILGVGPEAQDCGLACDASGGLPSPPVPAYYTCANGVGCAPAFLTLARQITNPVVRFATDNNGVILQMQPLSGVGTTASGNLIFGIGTQSNNGLSGAATIHTLDDFDNFTTVFNGQTMTGSFIDSGSNGLFFPDSAIPTCTGASFFYCPASLLGLSATNRGQNSAQTTVAFSVDNAVNLFQNNPSANAFSTLAGPNSPGSFDWGLPFFYGRTVFTSIRGQSMPSGAPAAPWWAY